MPYGGGLSAQLGFAQETTVGTQVTPTKFVEFLSESMSWDPTWLDGAGLRAGQAFKRDSRTTISRVSVGGEVPMEHADKGMGLLWKHALGSAITAPTLVSGTAYKQIHTPDSRTGLSLTTQAGRPQTDGTVQPFTWRGIKIPNWQFSVSDNAYAQLQLTFDGWQEATDTALAVAGYAAGAGVFSFKDASVFKLGGTAATTAGETTVTGGTAVQTVCRGITLTGATPMANERYGLGNAGVKREQIENGIPTITGSLDAEFTSRSEIYDLFKAGSSVPLQLDLAHGLASSGVPFLLSFILPACRLKQANPQVGGPDIVGQGIQFEAYDDGTNPPIQVKIVSTDIAL